MRLLLVAGARPNFMKVAPVMQAARARGGVETVLVHTGQHYDPLMSEVFFSDLGLAAPDHHLGVGSGTHAEQTAKVMLGLEPVVVRERPDWVIVVGDVNSTAAAALVAAKLGTRVAHVEAGLRSFDRTMPEELNRRVADALADLLLTPSADADANLRREGIETSRIRRVGNVMIDVLEQHLQAARARAVAARFGLAPRAYAVATLHRPTNVDEPRALAGVLALLGEVCARMPVLFPVHPRTRARLDAAKIALPRGLHLVEPMGYLDFLGLVDSSRLTLTDSGGVQEETTALGVPCITLRDRTERPITVLLGTNRLVGSDPVRLRRALDDLDNGRWSRGARPPLWDGHASERVIETLLDDRVEERIIH